MTLLTTEWEGLEKGKIFGSRVVRPDREPVLYWLSNCERLQCTSEITQYFKCFSVCALFSQTFITYLLFRLTQHDVCDEKCKQLCLCPLVAPCVAMLDALTVFSVCLHRVIVSLFTFSKSDIDRYRPTVLHDGNNRGFFKFPGLQLVFKNVCFH